MKTEQYHGGVTREQRLEKLRGMLDARTDRTGKPHPGYAVNVEQLKKEIARLESIEEAPTAESQPQVSEAFLKFDRDGDGKPGGSLPKEQRK